MANTTKNQRKDIAHRGSSHVAQATLPDMCFVAGKPEALPFDNWVESKRLGNGKTELTLCGNSPIWTAVGWLTPSEPVKPPRIGKGSTTYRLEAMATSWSPDVEAEGHRVVRTYDDTSQNRKNTQGVVLDRGAAGNAQLNGISCAALWARYKNEALKLIEPGDKDHRQRNRIISGAYANLALSRPDFQWAGLAAYASKQVGCAMDFASSRGSAGLAVAGAGRATPLSALTTLGGRGTHEATSYMNSQLGAGNRSLFLDIYPMHRFYMDHGYAAMLRCAAARTPPMTTDARLGFLALAGASQLPPGPERTAVLGASVEALARHEQYEILQREIYNNVAVQGLLFGNQFNTGGILTSPTSVVMASGCVPGRGDAVFAFQGWRFDNYQARMNWILNDIGGYYLRGTGRGGVPLVGSTRHGDDLRAIQGQGSSVGATYTLPPAGGR